MQMLKKYHTELLNKYSFIEKCEIKGSTFFIYYTHNGKARFKKLPIRATILQLQKALKRIQTELGVEIYGKGKYSDIYTTY